MLINNSYQAHMKKLVVVFNILLLVIAIILLQISFQLPLFLALLVVPLAYGWLQWRKKSGADAATDGSPERMRFQSVADVESALGSPDATILTNATRGNELGGNILVYYAQRLLVIDGLLVKMDDIADVSTVNMATPYTPGDYFVVLTMRKPRKDYIRLAVGKDADYAMQVATDIIDSLKSDASH